MNCDIFRYATTTTVFSSFFLFLFLFFRCNEQIYNIELGKRIPVYLNFKKERKNVYLSMDPPPRETTELEFFLFSLIIWWNCRIFIQLNSLTEYINLDQFYLYYFLSPFIIYCNCFISNHNINILLIIKSHILK